MCFNLRGLWQDDAPEVQEVGLLANLARRPLGPSSASFVKAMRDDDAPDGWAPTPTKVSRRLYGASSPSGKLLQCLCQKSECSPRPHCSPAPGVLLTPRTGSTRASGYTAACISTPESMRSSPANSLTVSPGGCGDAWPGDSEMELALELVNHISPEVADRLIERLRAAEAARMAAEERCRRAEERCRAAKSLGASPLRSAKCRQGYLVLSLLLALLLVLGAIIWGGTDSFPRRNTWQEISTCPSGPEASALISSGSGAFVQAPAEVIQQDEEAKEEADVEDVNLEDEQQLCGTDDSDDEIQDVCGALVREAQEEAQELRAWNAEIQERFGHSVHAISQWVAFLKSVWGADGPNSIKERRLNNGELEAHCIQSALPGRNALNDLAESLSPAPARRLGRNLPPLAPQLPPRPHTVQFERRLESARILDSPSERQR